MMTTDSFPDWLELIADSLKPAKVIGVDPLRQWSLSQVFRLTLDDEGRTLIAKRGVPTKGPTELEIYQECLIPLAIDVPTIFASYASDSEYILLMEDLSGTDLEQQPSKSTFLAAARTLANIRTSTDRIGKISASNLQRHLLTKDQLLLDFDCVIGHAGSEHREMVHALGEHINSFSRHLDRLYQELPLTLNHNDYHAKNLLNVSGRIVPVDWANARISPHLGDLYCLINEGKDQHISREILIDAYRFALKDRGRQEEVTDWHLNMGGLCWNVHCLQWILEFGLDTIPISKTWVPNFLTEIHAIISRLDKP